MELTSIDYLTTGVYDSLEKAADMVLARCSNEKQINPEMIMFLMEVQKAYRDTLTEDDKAYLSKRRQEYTDKKYQRSYRTFDYVVFLDRQKRAKMVERAANEWIKKNGGNQQIKYSSIDDIYIPGDEHRYSGREGIAGNINIFEYMPKEKDFFPLCAFGLSMENGTRVVGLSCVNIKDYGDVSFIDMWVRLEKGGAKWDL